MDDERFQFLVQFTRTQSLIKALATGKELIMKNGNILAMGEDMSIGYLVRNQDDETSVIGDFTFKQLNDLFEKNGFGRAIK